MEFPRNRKPYSRIPQVSLYFPYLSNCFYGIFRYEQLHGPWNISLMGDIQGDCGQMDFPKQQDSGRIIRFGKNIVPELFQADVPAVVTDPLEEHLQFPQVARMTRFVFDSKAVGKMAAEYFLQKRFPHYGYVGFFCKANWSDWRRDSYLARLREEGIDGLVYQPLNIRNHPWSKEQKRMALWLKSIPKPIALFAANDYCGIQVMDTCQQCGIDVPEEVAVLGVDNHEILCQCHHPTLSSIQTFPKEQGFRYATILDRLMRGEERMGKIYTYGPTEVVSRQSTQCTWIEDKLVARAVEFIRINFGMPIGVPDVLKFTNVSRRTLEVRFQKELGHSILQEITRLRMEKLSRLLRETSLPLRELASLCGYWDDTYMGKVFQKYFACSMTQYRKKYPHS
ncbi:MAG: DNA-binding transcriptional regulator [Planctomycetia bacterium]|nr:DNA-binding transcriptional regulator [Planctomycetia bacterium]